MIKEQREEKHKNPVPTVDFLISKDGNSKILLVRGKKDPYKGLLSIPGGFYERRRNRRRCMTHEVKEETSLILEPLATLCEYSDPLRDPTMHTISATFTAKIANGKESANDYGADLQWIKIEGELHRLIETNHIALDHSKNLADSKNWRRVAQGAIDENIKNIPTFWSKKKR